MPRIRREYDANTTQMRRKYDHGHILVILMVIFKAWSYSGKRIWPCSNMTIQYDHDTWSYSRWSYWALPMNMKRTPWDTLQSCKSLLHHSLDRHVMQSSVYQRSYLSSPLGRASIPILHFDPHHSTLIVPANSGLWPRDLPSCSQRCANHGSHIPTGEGWNTVHSPSACADMWERPWREPAKNNESGVRNTTTKADLTVT